MGQWRMQVPYNIISELGYPYFLQASLTDMTGCSRLGGGSWRRTVGAVCAVCTLLCRSCANILHVWRLQVDDDLMILEPIKV